MNNSQASAHQRIPVKLRWFPAQLRRLLRYPGHANGLNWPRLRDSNVTWTPWTCCEPNGFSTGLGCHSDGATPQFSSPASVRPESQRNAASMFIISKQRCQIMIHELSQHLVTLYSRSMLSSSLSQRTVWFSLVQTKQIGRFVSSFIDKPYRTRPYIQYWLFSKALDGHQHWF